jgi:uncharacterized RDD family membrane protein YckC
MSEQEPQVPPPGTAGQPPAQQPAPGAPPTQPAWTAQGPSGPRASFGRRLVAYLLDVILVGIASGILAAILGEAAGYGIGTLAGLAYFVFFEGGPKGQTLGKMALGIRVIDFNTGGPIGYGRAIIRYLGRIVSAVVCFLGYLWMLWDKEKQTWHDKFATSVVVPVQFYPVS